MAAIFVGKCWFHNWACNLRIRFYHCAHKDTKKMISSHNLIHSTTFINSWWPSMMSSGEVILRSSVWLTAEIDSAHKKL